MDTPQIASAGRTSSTPTIDIVSADAAMSQFERRTNRYGSLTMTAGLILSLVGPLYLLLFGGVEVTPEMAGIAFLAVAATFGVFWVVEPLTYFPVLGSAAMYQAFMVGNISNKLLPAAIVAQASIGAKPGSRRGNIAAVMAICGAATVHLTSLLLFVGVLGTWLVGQIPQDVIEVARVYILPALMGAVLVQCIVAMKQLRTTVVAVLVALGIEFGLLVVVPAQVAPYATAIAVLVTIVLAWLVRDRSREEVAAE